MRPARVLIVEDEFDWQDIVVELLADEGHVARTAHNYESALAQLEQESFNVVFLDMMLGEFDLPVRGGSGWRLLDQRPGWSVTIPLLPLSTRVRKT
jgi:CheY-like chemotaxis protein